MSTYVNALKSAKDIFQCFFALFSFDFIDYLHNEISKYWKTNDMNNDKCCSHEHALQNNGSCNTIIFTLQRIFLCEIMQCVSIDIKTYIL